MSQINFQVVLKRVNKWLIALKTNRLLLLRQTTPLYKFQLSRPYSLQLILDKQTHKQKLCFKFTNAISA